MNNPKNIEKVLIGIGNAPPSFDVRDKVVGPKEANLQYITNETGAVVTIRGLGSGYIEPETGQESLEPLHICIEHSKHEVLQAGRQLAFNLINTVQQEWSKLKDQKQQGQKQRTPSGMSKVCPRCKKNLANKGSLYRHMRVVHEETNYVEATKKSYPPTSLRFDEVEQFKEWKNQVEGEDGAFFVVTSTKKLGDGGKKSYYICNRSGRSRRSVPEDRRKRRFKIQGSSKINGTCTARFTAHFTPEGIIVTDFHRVHSSHESEPIHLPIPPAEKERIASEIAAKVPFDYILDSIRSDLPTDEVSRIHLITKQDLRNIAAQFGIEKEGKMHPDDATSVHAWVLKEQANADKSSILLYKPTGEESHGLGEDEFLLAIMTDQQKEMLQKFGKDVIAIDSTHGTNAYNFEMTTLLVSDESGQGFPCAFLFSYRTHQPLVEIFLTAIREKVGVVSPKVFMSDMDESFYSAWLAVMGPYDRHLYCTWHVLRDWQKNLNTITDQEKKNEAWKRVRALLIEADKDAFLKMLTATIEWLCTDEITVNFGNYFSACYSGNDSKWAYCFRKNVGVNTNMHVEQFQKGLKYSHMNGKVAKRLDLTIHNLMRLVRGRLLDRLRSSDGGKLVSKIRCLRLRHNSSGSLSTDNVFDSSADTWSVFSADFVNIYEVKLANPSCSCSVLCEVCNACYHKFSCSCYDHVVSSNMCEHIHLVCRFLSQGEAIRAHREEASPPRSLENDKEELCALAQSVIQKCSTKRQICVVKKCLEQMDLTLDAVGRKKASQDVQVSVA